MFARMNGSMPWDIIVLMAVALVEATPHSNFAGGENGRVASTTNITS